MAKQVILDLLESTIGRYVLNLDASALNVAIWKGNIELKSLALNVDAVNGDLQAQALEAPNLAAPFRVVEGSFESLKVEVPWSKLSRSSVVFRAKCLHIKLQLHDFLAGVGQQSNELNPTKEMEARQLSIEDAEKGRTRTIALMKLATGEDGFETNSNEKDGFGARLLRRVIENLQIEVSDIKIELISVGCKVGAVLHSLTLNTTDETGKPSFVNRSKEEHFLWKALHIAGLALYCDQEEVPIRFSQLHSTPHDYILAPLSFDASLKMCDLRKCVEFSKYDLKSKLSDINISLSRIQAENFLTLLSKLQQMKPKTQILFPEYRPLAPILSGNSKAWWKYAFRCVGRLNRRRSWVEFFQAFQKRQRYIILYKRQKNCSQCRWLLPLNAEEARELSDIENDRSISVFGLMTWRSLSDGQIELEKSKRDSKLKNEKKKFNFSNIFGGNHETKTDDTVSEPPITLTIEELKELENLSYDQAEKSELSEDSKLANVRFELGSLSIQLFNNLVSPISTLCLETFRVNFLANVDGSLSLKLNLHSLTLQDQVTMKTNFPFVMKTILSSADAFDFRLDKSSNGDQSIKFGFQTVEVVLSPQYILRLLDFASFEQTSKAEVQDLKTNLSLAQPSTREDTTTSGDSLTSSIADAWYSKKGNASLKIDCNLQAPIIVIPQDCTDVNADVMTLNMGHFRFMYGFTPAAKIVEWFESSPYILDTLSLEMSRFALYIGTVGDKLSSSIESSTMEAIIEPLSLSVDMGVETSSGKCRRLCIDALLPVISIAISTKQMSQMVKVASAWSRFAKDLASKKSNQIDHNDTETNFEQKSGTNRDKLPIQSNDKMSQMSYSENRVSGVPESDGGSPTREIDTVVAYLALQRLSVKIIDGSDTVEAQLVSVCFSVAKSNSGRSLLSLQMGWFWILERLRNRSYRRAEPVQRLLVHSDLPHNKDWYADFDFNIVEDMKRLGVFDNTYTGSSSDLADITVEQIIDENMTVNNVDINLCSLRMQWNPHIFADLLEICFRLSRFASECIKEIVGFSDDTCDGNSLDTEQVSIDFDENNGGQNGVVVSRLKSSLKSISLVFNSAIDDLPLFSITLGRSLFEMESTNDDSIAVSVNVGDVRIETQLADCVCSTYSVIFGLKESRIEDNTSLLTLKYKKGKAVNVEYQERRKDKNSFVEAYANIDLSPVRVIFIQAQILNFLEYLTSGILGTLTSQLASSAAAVAVNVANAVSGEQLYFINVPFLEVVLPQAANKSEHFTLSLDGVAVSHHMFADCTGGAESLIQWQNVLISNHDNSKVVTRPFAGKVRVELPSHLVSLDDERSMIISIVTGPISFCLMRSQYLQLLLTLDENIGDPNPYFRESSLERDDTSYTKIESSPDDSNNVLSHGGKISDKKEESSRLHFKLEIEAALLLLCDEHPKYPIVSIGAKNACISFHSYPDMEKDTLNFSVYSLIVKDERLETTTNSFPYLFLSDENVSIDDVFKLSVTKIEKKMGCNTQIRVGIGQPIVTFLPSLVNDLLKFVEIPKKKIDEEYFLDENDEVFVDVQTVDDGVEMMIAPKFPSFHEDNCNKISVMCGTDEFKLILVDMGSSRPLQRKSMRGLKETILTEVVVIQGKMDGSYQSSRSIPSGDELESSIEVHSQNLQICKAQGSELLKAVQILEPANFSLVFSNSKRNPSDRSTRTSIKLVTLNSICLALSMQDFILFQAIISSINVHKDSFEDIEEVKDLTDREESQLKKIAELLKEDEDSFSSSTSFSHDTRSDSILSRDSLSVHGLITKDLDETSVLEAQITLTQFSITIINDLQGMDHALFKIGMENMLFGTNVVLPIVGGDKLHSEAIIDSNLHTSFTADYFDSTSNRWEPLILNYWEWTMRMKRKVKGENVAGPKMMASYLEVDARPCEIKFSEQFLVSIGGANRMFGIYSAKDEKRFLITPRPYGVENSCGVSISFRLRNDLGYSQLCRAGETQFFRFEYAPGKGIGGQRLYGQDSVTRKEIEVDIGGTKFSPSTTVIVNIDDRLHQTRCQHLRGGKVIFVEVSKTSTAILIRIKSRIQITNCGPVPFRILCQTAKGLHDIGICGRKKNLKNNNQFHNTTAISNPTTRPITKRWPSIGVPIDTLPSYDDLTSIGSGLSIMIGPLINECKEGEDNLNKSSLVGWWGSIPLPMPCELRKREFTDEVTTHDIECVKEGFPVFLARASVKVDTIDDEAFVQIYIEPRLVLANRLPVGVFIETPMPYTFNEFGFDGIENDVSSEAIHLVKPHQFIYIYTPGPSIAISVKLSDAPISGGLTTWVQDKWLSISLVENLQENEVISCFLPFIDGQGGHEIFLVNDDHSFVVDRFHDPIKWRVSSMLSFVSANVGVDHTGDFLFNKYCDRHELSVKGSVQPWSAFSPPRTLKRITLLPESSSLIRLVYDTSGEAKQTNAFSIEDIVVGAGGLETSAIILEDKTNSGYFAYRLLGRNELHIIPNYIVFNGCNQLAIICSELQKDFELEQGTMAPLKVTSKHNFSALFKIKFSALHVCTELIEVKASGLQIIPLIGSEQSLQENERQKFLGSISIQTVVGSADSRWVIKIGELKLAGDILANKESEKSFFDRESMRLHFKLEDLQATLCDTARPHPDGLTSFADVVKFRFKGALFDHQTIFKPVPNSPDLLKKSQIALIFEDFWIVDCNPNSDFPMVCNSTAQNSVLDVLISLRDRNNSELIKVDKINMNIGYREKKKDKISLGTSEEFVWSLIDISHRIADAVHIMTEVSSNSFQTNDTLHDLSDNESNDDEFFIAESGDYEPPRSDSLYNIKMIRVSPILLEITFKRKPVTTRYETLRGKRGARLMNYFTQTLKFTVDKAALNFSGWKEHDIKGPPDRIKELFIAEYTRRIKSQIFSLLRATSIQDWRNLTGREDGSDNYIAGDFFRSTGTLTGRSANFILKKSSSYVGIRISRGADSLGESIAKATDSIGAGEAGRRVSVVVSGLGQGVGDTVTGVGTGAGKIIKGAGTGIGQIFGGIGGGVVKVSKGVKKGVKGDTDAMFNDFSKGANSLGKGLTGGVTTVATGIGSGLSATGKGIFSGAKKIGVGLRNSVTNENGLDEKE